MAKVDDLATQSRGSMFEEGEVMYDQREDIDGRPMVNNIQELR